MPVKQDESAALQSLLQARLEMEEMRRTFSLEMEEMKRALQSNEKGTQGTDRSRADTQRHLGEVWKPGDDGPILARVGGANLPPDGGSQDRFGYSCSAAGECAAEAIFCCPTENSHHLKS
jgi:hypothetical protein